MASKRLSDPSDLNCSICLHAFADPRVLPCVHSFCYSCLEGWIKESGSSQTIRCPLCMNVSPLPSGGLKKIKSNYFLTYLVEKMHKKDLKSTHGEFDSPKENIPFSILSYIYCHIHAKNTIDHYCVECHLAACDICLLQYHRQHNLVDLKKHAAISKRKLQGVFMKTNVLIKLIDEQINESGKHYEQSTIDIKKIKSQINNVIDGMSSIAIHQMISKLNHQRQQVFYSLNAIHEQKEKVMMTVHDGQEFSKAAVTSLRTYTNNLLSHGRDYDIVQQAGDIQSRLVSITKARVRSFVWNYYDMDMTNRMSLFAWSHLADKGAPLKDDITVAKVSLATDVIDTEAKNSFVTDNVVSKISLTKSGTVTGLEVVNQTIWVVHIHESSLYAYSVTSPHRPRSLFIKGLSDPADIVRFPPEESQLVISDRNRKQLVWLKLDKCGKVRKVGLVLNGSWKVTSQRTLMVGYRPLGLGVCKDQLLVSDIDDNVIHVLSM